jgi:predicted enzyme related to lactoylglutathione lyase
MPQEVHDRRIDYIEYPVPDVAAAKSFYSAVFGWEFTDYGPDYTCFSDGRLAGGFATSTAAVPGGPLVVIYSVDLAAIEAVIADHGGKIVKPLYDFPGGKRFHFRDPFGYELAVWSDK